MWRAAGTTPPAALGDRRFSFFSSFHINLERPRKAAAAGAAGRLGDTFHNPRLIVSRIRTTKAFRPSEREGERASGLRQCVGYNASIVSRRQQWAAEGEGEWEEEKWRDRMGRRTGEGGRRM